jgi:hypothetical protein
MGIAATGFCYLGGILQLSIDKISKIYGCRQQQPDRIRLIIGFVIGRFRLQTRAGPHRRQEKKRVID